LAGIYLHIPFCRRKCPYCNFFSLASKKQRDAFLSALKKEISLTRGFLGEDPVETIYFGGGTPSVFSPSVLNEIIVEDLASKTDRNDAMTRRNYPERKVPSYPPQPLPARREGQGEGTEITLEINPEDATGEFVSELRETAFNRVSLGVQSFHEPELKFLGREHSAEQSSVAVRRLQTAGFTNISIDLIYGIPGSSDDAWKKNLEIALSLGVPHISAYALTVEEGTPLAWMTGKGRAAPVDDERQAAHFRILMEMMRSHGYLHYEISNFCLPGRESRHNTAYWQGKKYLGLGPSAHCYNGLTRRWNVSNLTRYIESMEQGMPLWEEEILTPEMQSNEYIMTSLRTMWGCNENRILDPLYPNKALVKSALQDFKARAKTWENRGFMKSAAGTWYLTDEGKLFADAIAADLFFCLDAE